MQQCRAHPAPVSMARWLFANSPTFASRAGIEAHLRIPAEYHRRPREQRETGDSGRDEGTRDVSREGGYGGRRGGRKKKKRKRGGEKLDGRIRKRVHRLGRLFVLRSLMSSTPGPYLFQPHRCTLALGTRPPWLSPPSAVPELL